MRKDYYLLEKGPHPYIILSRLLTTSSFPLRRYLVLVGRLPQNELPFERITLQLYGEQQ